MSTSSSARPSPDAGSSTPRFLSSEDRYAVRMPLNEPADSMEEAVRDLMKRDPADLRRARRHHRRALAALRSGCYDAVGEDTRAQLVQRLRADLKALTRALQALETRPAPPSVHDFQGDGATALPAPPDASR